MDKILELIKSEINNLNILSKMNNIDEIIKERCNSENFGITKKK